MIDHFVHLRITIYAIIFTEKREPSVCEDPVQVKVQQFNCLVASSQVLVHYEGLPPQDEERHRRRSSNCCYRSIRRQPEEQ